METYWLKRTVKPSAQPVTAEEVKLYSVIPYSQEDALVERWIKAATELAEDYQYRSYLTQTWQMTFDKFPAKSCFLVPRSPLISVVSIKYTGADGTEYTLDPSEYIVSTQGEIGKISLTYLNTWPTTTLQPVDAVTVTFTAGYGADASAVPEHVKDAIFVYCAHRYEFRAGEGGEIPKQFYNILSSNRMVVRDALAPR
jgi:uncharacterized phiE125 gp8 family phage protein